MSLPKGEMKWHIYYQDTPPVTLSEGHLSEYTRHVAAEDNRQQKASEHVHEVQTHIIKVIKEKFAKQIVTVMTRLNVMRSKVRNICLQTDTSEKLS